MSPPCALPQSAKFVANFSYPLHMNWERTVSFSGPSKGGLYQCVERDGMEVQNEFVDEASLSLEKAKANAVVTESLPFKREFEGTVYCIYRACIKLSR